MKITVQFILITIIFFSASAQTNLLRSTIVVPDSNTAAIRFERNVNTYQWNAGALVKYDDRDLFVNFGSKLTSVIIRSNFLSFRDEQNYSLSVSKKYLRSSLLSQRSNRSHYRTVRHLAAPKPEFIPVRQVLHINHSQTFPLRR